MIIDLRRFISGERASWQELEGLLNRLEAEPNLILSVEEARHFHRLYERTAADLAKINTFASEPETRSYLENLVARAYGEIHETREKRSPLKPLRWFFQTLPQTFRRHVRAFWLAILITIVGALFGGGAVLFDPDSKPIIMPFSHLLGDPAERVAKEESATKDHLSNVKTTFSASLMTHNTRVAILALALGMTWGVGTIVLLFYNGVILGAVIVDYLQAGQASFLCGWLLPHGSVEIPAILIGGQAGLVLAGALIGWGSRSTLTVRLRKVGADLLTLISGVAILLVWAGIVESYLSQYHEPVFPYWAKITLGLIELGLLFLFLFGSGKSVSTTSEEPPR